MLSTRVHMDFETRSACNIKASGGHAYAMHETTRPLCLAYAWDINDVRIWIWGNPLPEDLLNFIASGGTIAAHHASFERSIWNMMRERYFPNIPLIHPSQQICTMAKGVALGLPASLDELGEVLGLSQQKDKEGSKAMLRVCKPRKVLPDGTIEWNDNVADLSMTYDYCKQDVRAEFAIDMALPDLSESEQELWVLDQVINDRGLYIDLPAVIRAVDLVEMAKKRNNEEINRITDGAVSKCSEIGKIQAWMNERGIPCETFTKDDHEAVALTARARGDLDACRVVELRQQSSKTSTSKFTRMLECVGDDNRVRGTLAYHGAATGRWAGRLIQIQNLPRVDHEKEGGLIEFITSALHNDDYTGKIRYEILEMVSERGVMESLMKFIRGSIMAAPGNKLIGGDFANIEGRVNAWLAGEEWKLRAFEEYDTFVFDSNGNKILDRKGKPQRKGPDLYKVAASGILGKPVEGITDAERQSLGKTSELALGYQGGVGAFVKMMGNTDPNSLIPPVKSTVSEQEWEEQKAKYAKATDRHGLAIEPWAAIKTIVRKWREKHPLLTQAWRDLTDAAIDAIDNPGTAIPVYGGRSRYLYSSQEGWLYCQLPSGRVMCYSAARVDDMKAIETEVNGERRSYTYETKNRDSFLGRLQSEGAVILWDTERSSRSVAFMGRDGKTAKWAKKRLYGGLQCENIVQAAARCILDRGMRRIERAGYPIITCVHDEIVSEVPAVPEFNERTFRELMEMKESWYATLPISVGSWEDERYVK